MKMTAKLKLFAKDLVKKLALKLILISFEIGKINCQSGRSYLNGSGKFTGNQVFMSWVFTG